MENMETLSIFLLTVGFTLSFVGVVGNLIIISFLIKKKGMRNKVNRILFTNLAVADLSVLLFFHTYQALYWAALIQESNITCRVVQPVSYAFVTVSVMSLLLISFHRHRVITREMDQEWSQINLFSLFCLFGLAHSFPQFQWKYYFMNMKR